MDEPDVLVVGAGLAGTAAACVASELGCRVLLVDHAPVGGGAVARQPLDPAAAPAATPHARRWLEWQARLRAQAARVETLLNAPFGGVDADGRAILIDTGQGRHRAVRPRALILATGATERVWPRPGWHLPGVMTAGGVQALLKMTGTAPPGPILLAGSGPLLLAVAAQLCAAGRPPVAVVEAGQPVRHWRSALRLPPGYWREAFHYRLRLWLARVPWLQGSDVQAIERREAGLCVTVRSPQGPRTFEVTTVALHDGLTPNDYGAAPPADLLVRRAGDCAGIAGAWAADAHGACVGAEVAQRLSHGQVPTRRWQHRVESARRAQSVLAEVFAPAAPDPLWAVDEHTVLCRCEHRTLRHLRDLGPEPTVRELRLLGRFGMGACQGRYCLESVARLCATPQRALDARRIAAARWPWRPLSIAALVQSDPTSPPR